MSRHKLNIVEFLASANQDEIALEAINEVEGYYEGKVIWFEYEDIGKKRKYWKCDGIKQICKPISICVVIDQLLRRKDKEIVKAWDRMHVLKICVVCKKRAKNLSAFNYHFIDSDNETKRTVLLYYCNHKCMLCILNCPKEFVEATPEYTYYNSRPSEKGLFFAEALMEINP